MRAGREGGNEVKASVLKKSSMLQRREVSEVSLREQTKRLKFSWPILGQVMTLCRWKPMRSMRTGGCKNRSRGNTIWCKTRRGSKQWQCGLTEKKATRS